MRKYFKHLMGNWIVALKAVGLFFFHFLHGLFPCKITEHGFWGLKLKEGDAVDV